MARRREFEIFSLSFLSAMTCAFGAVILLFMIISANVEVQREEALEDLQGDVDRAELKVLTGRKNLLQQKTDLARLLDEWTSIQARRNNLSTEICATEEELTTVMETSASRRAAIERLRAELSELESENERLKASATPEEGRGSLRSFEGEGNRQYLTGLRMGGRRVVVLVDVSTSMLDRTIVNVLRRRNMSEEQQRQSPKWRQVVNTVDWLTTQLEAGTQFQIIAFNSRAWSLVEGTDGQWLTVTDGSELGKAVETLRGLRPEGPTSLQVAFNAARQLQPRPDNIFLLVDGLPTMGEIVPTRQGVTGKERLDHFNRAARDLPGAPINVILFAMEGDPRAAPAFWWLALRTGGSLLAPAEDWP